MLTFARSRRGCIPGREVGVDGGLLIVAVEVFVLCGCEMNASAILFCSCEARDCLERRYRELDSSCGVSWLEGGVCIEI